ncbi:hypothetical protein [Actinophytocola sp.]|uniref:hypothetical protein n=1 Tax=Actinophytocola sp. TaxID=1872138 RepID=UPI002ED10E44
MPKYLARALTAATLTLLVGACAGNANTDRGVASLSDSDQPSAQQQGSDGKTDEDKNREFARCMREHGIDVPDPEPGHGGVTIKERDLEKVKPAREACQHLLPNGGVPEKMDSEQLDRERERAKCMREHGIDVPDPDPNNPRIRPPDGVDPEKMKAAMEACRPDDAPDDGPVRTGTNE